MRPSLRLLGACPAKLVRQPGREALPYGSNNVRQTSQPEEDLDLERSACFSLARMAHALFST